MGRHDRRTRALAGGDYCTLDSVRSEQKTRAKGGWARRSDFLVNARHSLRAIKDSIEDESQQVVVSYMDAMTFILQDQEQDDDIDIVMLDGGANTTVAQTTPGERGILAPGGSAGGSGGASSQAGTPRLDMPRGRSPLVTKFVDARGDVRLTNKVIKQMVIIRAKSLMRGVLGLLERSPDTLDAFAKAGKGLVKQLAVYEELRDADDRWSADKSEANFDKLEAIEEEFEKIQEYTTAAEYGPEKQTKYLKTLDYGDVICDGWRRFYVCKSRDGAQKVCGYAYPSKLWMQKGRVASVNKEQRLKPGNWKYYCFCMWEYLEEEATDQPNGPAARWFRDLLQCYGEMGKFPHFGCGSMFKPWARGPSVVCEVLIANKWEAFLADQCPTQLDDQLKRLSFEALSEAFGAMEPEDMLKAIPVTMPMTHLEDYNGKRMEGIARYPVDAWIKAGDPCFTSEMWAKICIVLAERALISPASQARLSNEDADVFERLLTVSTSLAPPS